MPRKQNGFGNPKSFAFKGGGRVDVGKVKGAAATTRAIAGMAQQFSVQSLNAIT